MKAKEFIYNLRTNLQDVDDQLQYTTDQHLMYMLDSARAVLASQKMDSKVNIVQMSQVVDVKPTTAPKLEIGTVGESNVLKLIIPKPIAYSGDAGIFTVGATDGQDSYTRITYSQLRTVLYRKYTASSPKWFLLNNAIYIINSEIDSLTTVRVRGVFDEPVKVEQAMGRFKYLTPYDWEYPLTMKDAKTVYQIAMAGDFGWGSTAAQSVNVAANKQRKDNELLSTLKGLGNAKV
jgi:hypothetical protein